MNNTRDSHLQLENQLQQVKKMTAEHENDENRGTLTIPKKSTQDAAEDSLDEIYIDVRGQLHHRSEAPLEELKAQEQNSSLPKTTT